MLISLFVLLSMCECVCVCVCVCVWILALALCVYRWSLCRDAEGRKGLRKGLSLGRGSKDLSSSSVIDQSGGGGGSLTRVIAAEADITFFIAERHTHTHTRTRTHTRTHTRTRIQTDCG